VSNEVLSLFDEARKEFSHSWKDAHSKPSEKSVHYLRVNSRRLIATLELMQRLYRDQEIESLRGRVKKVLKRLGPLRDIQVQLETIVPFQQRKLIGDFKANLQRREQREIKKLHDELKGGKKNHLARAMRQVSSEFNGKSETLSHDKVKHAAESLIGSRCNEFLRAKRKFQGNQLSEDALHEMRIALKKLRYIVEALPSALNSRGRLRPAKMRRLQKLMGESRDLELLRESLETWSRRKGRFLAIVAVSDELKEKRRVLQTRITAVSEDLERTLKPQIRRPAVETTRAIVPSPEAEVVPMAAASVVEADFVPAGPLLPSGRDLVIRA